MTFFGGLAMSTTALMNQGSLLLIPLCIMLIVMPGLGKRTLSIGRDLSRSPVQPSYSKLTTNLCKVSQSLVQSSFHYICGWRFQATALFSMETATLLTSVQPQAAFE